MKMLLRKILELRGAPDTAVQTLFFLVGLQIFFNPITQITAVHEVSFYLSVLILSYLLARQKESHSFLRSPLTVPFGLFVLWSVIGLPVALHQANSIHDVYAHLIKYILLYYLLIFTVRTEGKFIILTWLVTISSFLFSIGIMIHYYVILGNGLSNRLGVLTYSEMPNNIIPTITVFAAIISACHFIRAKALLQRIIATGFIIVFMLTTFATQSKGALIAFVVGMLSFLSVDKKKLAAFMFAFCLAIGTLQMTTHFFTPMLQRLGQDPRIGIWYNYLEISKDHPIAGIGFGMQTYHDDALLHKYNERVPTAYRENLLIRAPHNMLIDVAVRTGWVGLGFLFIIIASYLRIGWTLIYKRYGDFITDWGRCALAAFIALFIQGMLENILSGPPAVILYVIFAMATILWKMPDITARKPGATLEK